MIRVIGRRAVIVEEAEIYDMINMTTSEGNAIGIYKIRAENQAFPQKARNRVRRTIQKCIFLKW